MANAINWFEIPCLDFERAQKFYATVLGYEVARWEHQGCVMGMLCPEHDQNTVGGAIVCHPEAVPSSKGTLVYLNGGADLAPLLARVEGAGGKITMPKTQISPEIGYMAVFEDTEGNRVAFHSPG